MDLKCLYKNETETILPKSNAIARIMITKLAANREERPTTDTYVAIASIKKAENKTKYLNMLNS